MKYNFFKYLSACFFSEIQVQVFESNHYLDLEKYGSNKMRV